MPPGTLMESKNARPRLPGGMVASPDGFESVAARSGRSASTRLPVGWDRMRSTAASISGPFA
jgi:hypothetical protein